MQLAVIECGGRDSVNGVEQKRFQEDMYDSESDIASLRDRAIQATQRPELIEREKELLSECKDLRQKLHAEWAETSVETVLLIREAELNQAITKLLNRFLMATVQRDREFGKKLIAAAEVLIDLNRLALEASKAKADLKTMATLRENANQISGTMIERINKHQNAEFRKYLNSLHDVLKPYKREKLRHKLLYNVAHLIIFLLVFTVLAHLGLHLIEPIAANLLAVIILWFAEEYFIGPKIHERFKSWKYSNLLPTLEHFYQVKRRVLYLTALLEQEFEETKQSSVAVKGT